MYGNAERLGGQAFWVTGEKGGLPNVVETQEKHTHTLQTY